MTTTSHTGPALRLLAVTIAVLLATVLSTGSADAAPAREHVTNIGGWAENAITLPDGGVIIAGPGLHRIDMTTKTSTKIADAPDAGGMALQGNTLYFVAGNSGPASHEGTLESINLDTGRRTLHQRNLPSPNGLALLPDGSLLYSVTLSLTEGGVYRTSPDKKTSRRISTLPVTPNGITVADDGTAYINSTLMGTITRLDPDTGKTSTLVGWLPILDDLTFAPDGNLYAASELGFIYRVHARTGARSIAAAGLFGATSATVYDDRRLIVPTVQGDVFRVSVR